MWEKSILDSGLYGNKSCCFLDNWEEWTDAFVSNILSCSLYIQIFDNNSAKDLIWWWVYVNFFPILYAFAKLIVFYTNCEWFTSFFNLRKRKTEMNYKNVQQTSVYMNILSPDVHFLSMKHQFLWETESSCFLFSPNLEIVFSSPEFTLKVIIISAASLANPTNEEGKKRLKQS